MNDHWTIRESERPLPALLGTAKELLLAELHDRLGDEGYPDIRPGHGCVFRFIDTDGTRLTDLAERAGMTKQAVGEVVSDLERLGYVERVPDPEDRRAKIIQLTERGWEAQAAGVRIFAEIEARWGEAVGEERMGRLRETLAAIAELDRAPAA
jgi:DNA-binding MarR family transcriptional regulator